MTASRSLFLVVLAAALGLLPALATPADRSPGPALRGESLTPAAGSILADIGQASWIRDGRSQHVLYVFFDPNCPYCHRVYEGLRAQVDFGEVELRWVPLGILMTTSLGKAASLLEAKDPTAALHRNEQGFTTERGVFGGIDEEPAPRDDTLKRLDRNLALLRRSGQDAVPSLLYRSRDGKPHLVRGAPPQSVLERIVQDLE
jgi:thiol:disulfide interchange protein DsbG